MENTEIEEKAWFKEMGQAHRRGKIMGGLLLVTIGALFLARELGTEFPAWLFSWKTLLIGFGIVSAVKHKFRNAAWIFLIGVGGVFLLGDVYPDLHIKPVLWPVLIIFIGLFMMFKPRRHYFGHKHFRKAWKHGHRGRWAHAYEQAAGEDQEDMIQAVSVMGGIKKNVYSKKFKGGEVVNVFGSAEINLMQADFEQQAKLEVTQVFGGTKLLIPANWEIKSELATVMGSFEDNRPNHAAPYNPSEKKVLILTGTTVMGGIEVNSY